MLRGRRERASSSSIPATSLLIPPNPAVADPGSSPTSRGGILLNPLNKDGSPTTSLPSNHPSVRSSSSLSSNTSRNIGNGVARGYYASRGGRRRHPSLSAYSQTSNTSSNDDAGSLSSASSTQSPRLKFAPLPESGRVKRSNSITLGVAARAQLLQGNGMGGGGDYRPAPQAPHWQQQVYTPGPSSPMWYNGGPIPENVKTFKDIKPGIKKAWGAIRRRRSSSNASSTSTSSLATNESGSESGSAISGSERGGSTVGTGSEGDISSINEEDEDEPEDTPPSTAGSSGGIGAAQGTQQPDKGAQSVTLTEEGVLVEQPPGSERFSTNDEEEGGQPLRRQNSDAYSVATTMSDAASEGSSSSEMLTDAETRGAYTSKMGLSESPSYTPGMGYHGHYYAHHHHLDGSGTRSGEATPRRGHSPTASPGSLSRTQSNRQQQQQLWTPSVSTEFGGGGGSGQGSMPGSGANTPRRRLSLGDVPSSSGGSSGRKGASVFGFDETQLRNRLGAMDLNSRRRRPQFEEAGEEHDGKEHEEDEDEVPMPVDDRQVRGAGLEVAV